MSTAQQIADAVRKEIVIPLEAHIVELEKQLALKDDQLKVGNILLSDLKDGFDKSQAENAHYREVGAGSLET